MDCFYEGENFLVINPSECIDCGVCEPECPVDAIKPQAEDEPDGKWLRINTQMAELWPSITKRGKPPEDADAYREEIGKFDRYVASSTDQTPPARQEVGAEKFSGPG